MGYTVLKNLVSDAKYSTWSHQQVADDLNAKTINRNRSSMSAREISDNFVKSEWDALTDAKRQHVLRLLAVEDIDPFGIFVEAFKTTFGAASQTIQDLSVARVEQISIAEQAGIGFVRGGDVRVARSL